MTPTLCTDPRCVASQRCQRAENDTLRGTEARMGIALDDIRCDVLDTGWPLGDDTDPERTPRRLVREVLTELAHVRDQRDSLQAACDRLRATDAARERFLRREREDAQDAEKGAAARDQMLALLDGFPVKDPCPEATRVADLLAEVERLREQRRLDNAEAARVYDFARDKGQARERDAVVAWLRAEALEWEETGPARLALGLMSDAIERGEHRREEET